MSFTATIEFGTTDAALTIADNLVANACLLAQDTAKLQAERARIGHAKRNPNGSGFINQGYFDRQNARIAAMRAAADAIYAAAGEKR